MERACPLFSPSNSDAGTAHGNYLTSLAADLAVNDNYFSFQRQL